MPTSSYVQAGTELLAAAMRDPAPIINLETFWQFMQVVEAFAQSLTALERTGLSYQGHIACLERIQQSQNDVTPEGLEFRMGNQLIEAFAAYTEQAASLLTFLIEHRPTAQTASLLEAFQLAMENVVRDVKEVPHLEALDQALATFEQDQMHAGS